MLYHSAPATVPNGFRVALVWRITCPETGAVTLATETRHRVRTRGTHRFFALVATPHGTRWMPSGEWDRRRPGLSAEHVGWALVPYGDGNAARMAHAAALDTDGAAAPASADAGGTASPCAACGGDGAMTFDTGRGTMGAGTCRTCGGDGDAPASPLPPRRWTDGTTPHHEPPARRAPAVAVVPSFDAARRAAGTRYRVTVHPGAPERDRCTCPSYRHGTGTAGDGSCKHIRARRREVERTASARAAAA
jgi:hypothetical protein